MTAPSDQDPRQYLGECVDRSRTQSSAAIRVAVDTNVEGMEDLSYDELRGLVDFTHDRFRLTAAGQEITVADGQRLYERQMDGRWTRRELPSGRYGLYDPRGMFDLLTSGCRSARATGERNYQVQYDRVRVDRWFLTGLDKGWTAATGSVAVDSSHRIELISVRLTTQFGDHHMETILTLDDYGSPVRIEPFAADHVIGYDDYLREVFGEDPLERFGRST